MVSGRSVSVSFLTMMMVMAMVTEFNNARSAPVETASTPGRSTISMPAKPIASAVIRRARTTSPRTSAAPMVAKSGAVKLSAVASAKGIRVIAVNPAAMPTMLNSDRAVYSPIRRVFITPGPWRINQGSIIRNARKLRKNTTSRECSCSAASLMKAPMVEKQIIAPIISRAARIGVASGGPAGFGAGAIGGDFGVGAGAALT